jgi:hypothetical protein
MNKFVLAIFAIIVVLGASMVGISNLQVKQNTDAEPVATASCLNEGAPDTTKLIVYNSTNYNLIKSDAKVVEESKFRGEMKQVSTTADGKGIYIMTGSNYFGEPSSADLIFVLKNTEIKAPYNFDIYLKDGVAIPDYIKNCKSTGGQITIVGGEAASDSFPPTAFNRKQIIGSYDVETALGYVYNQNKTTKEAILKLNGVKSNGELFLKTKNKNLPLYLHMGISYLVDNEDAYEYLPSATEIDLSGRGEQSLQLKKIVFVSTPTYSWWTPACKPAIYLYPQETQNVNVKVNTKGIFTLTIPAYPQNGWDVIANPNGEVKFSNKTYPYLYYESKIPQELIESPKTGFVVKKGELPGLFDDILPKLGLNKKESGEFKDYWKKVLPDFPYYFVGVMSQSSIDEIEPLDISPKPDTLIRVRLFFEGLKQKTSVEKPEILLPKRSGFTVVEWGGMVKTDKNNPFVCSQ